MKPVSLFIILSAFILTGCLQSFTTITVHRDGSAHIVDTLLVSTFITDMLQGLSGTEDSTQQQPSIPWNDSTVRARGNQLGSGVVLEGWWLVEKDGMKGYAATYKIHNINDVHLDRERSWDSMDFPRDSVNNAHKSKPITFSYTDGNLSIHNPMSLPNKQESETGKDRKDMLSSLSMMGQFLRNMRTSICVGVDGPIISTNAEHVSGQAITLFAVDFDKLVSTWQKDTSLAKQFESINQDNYDGLRQMLSKYPAGALVLDFNTLITVKF